MSDNPSTSPEEQEQTQLATPASQAQVNEQSAPSDGQIIAPPLPLPTSTKRKSRISPLVKSILIAQSLVLIIGAVVLLYLNVYEPARISAEATATTGTAFAKSTGTSVGATSTSQSIATKYAIRDATVTAEVIAGSIATITARQNLYKEATKGTPFISSPLIYDNSSANWDVTLHEDNTGCYFVGDAYHIFSKGGFYQDCYAANVNLTDFTYEVEVEIVSGVLGGLFFRANNGSGYVFHITSSGNYSLYRGDFDAKESYLSFTYLRRGSSDVINKGFNQKNLLTVVARGETLTLFINKQYITYFNERTYLSGKIGVYCESTRESGLTDIAFRNLKVWKL